VGPGQGVHEEAAKGGRRGGSVGKRRTRVGASRGKSVCVERRGTRWEKKRRIRMLLYAEVRVRERRMERRHGYRARTGTHGQVGGAAAVEPKKRKENVTGRREGQEGYGGGGEGGWQRERVRASARGLAGDGGCGGCRGAATSWRCGEGRQGGW
jgi:hypothetical protein